MSITVSDVYQQTFDIPIFEKTNDLLFAQKIRAIYTNKIRETLLEILTEENESLLVDRLESFLKHHWEVINNSMMSYTAQSQSSITKSLCQSAMLVCNYRNQHKSPEECPITPLEILIPGIKLESFNTNYSHLKSIKPVTSWNEDLEKELLERKYNSPLKKPASLLEKEKTKVNMLNTQIEHLEGVSTSKDFSLKKAKKLQKAKKKLNSLLVKEHEFEEYQKLLSLMEQKKTYLQEHELCTEKNGWLIPTFKKIERALAQSIFYDGSLIPVQVLLEEKKELINPYSSNYEPILEEALQRLKLHSSSTLAFCEARETLLEYISDKSTFLGRLTELCNQLKLNDAMEGTGKEENAGRGAYFAIINFHNYYQTLDPKEIEEKCPEVYKEIGFLLELAANPEENKNATENVDTCIAKRRSALEKLIRNNRVALSQIAFQGVKKGELIESQQQTLKETKHLLATSLKSFTYEGADPLNLSKKLLNYLNITIAFDLFSEVQQVMTLEPEEILEVITPEKGEKVASFFKDIDELVMFIHEHPTRTLKAFLKATEPHLFENLIKSLKNIKELLRSLSTEKFKMILEFLNHANLPYWQREKILFHCSEDFELLSMAWELIPEEERYSRLKEVDGNDKTILHHLTNEKYLRYFLSNLSKEKQKERINAEDKQGNTLLHHATNSKEALEYLLQIYPEAVYDQILNKENKLKETVFHFAAQNGACFKLLIERVPKQDLLKAIVQKDSNNKTVLDHAMNNPHLLGTLLGLFPDDERLRVMSQKNLNEHSLFRCTLEKGYQTIESVLEKIPTGDRLKLILESKESGNTVLHAAAKDPGAVHTLLKFLSPRERLIAVRHTNNKGKSLLDLITKRNDLEVKNLLRALANKESVDDEILLFLQKNLSYKKDKNFIHDFFHECICSFNTDPDFFAADFGKTDCQVNDPMFTNAVSTSFFSEIANKSNFNINKNPSVLKETIETLLVCLKSQTPQKILEEKQINYIKSDKMLLKIIQTYEKMRGVQLLNCRETTPSIKNFANSENLTDTTNTTNSKNSKNLKNSKLSIAGSRFFENVDKDKKEKMKDLEFNLTLELKKKEKFYNKGL